MDADVIVVGAGIGGLSAAIRLAVTGRRVLVLERNSSVGGKMSEWTEDGFRWDTGPSVVTMRPVFEEFFASLGRRLEAYLDLAPVEPLTRYFYPDGFRLDLSRDLPRTLQQISRLEPRDVDGYLAFLAYAARLNRLTAPVFTFGPPPSLTSMAQIAPLDGLWVAGQALRSMDFAIRAHVRSPHLRQLLGRFATYVGSSPYQVSAVLAVIAHVELNEGVWYPRGGVYAIVRALERLAGELGVAIRTNAEVVAISCSQNRKREKEESQAEDDPSRRASPKPSKPSRHLPPFRVSGVVLATGETLTASTVVANLDVATVYERLLPREALFRRRLARLERMPPSCSGFVLLLGVEGEHVDLAHHNIFFSSDYPREFCQIFAEGLPPDDPTIYIAITSKTDPEHAPSGCENWFVLVNAPAADGRFNWDVHKEDYAELVLRRLAERGFDVRGRLRVRRIVAPPDLERLNGARRGALYGVSFNDRFAPFKRPANRCSEVDGLYFVGGTTHPGGGVPMVMLSGKVVAEMIAGDGR
ncbi:MAG: phytoene desaturase family protein [Anaerolineales bacterium]|nr:phytoene desaturase family protein [Anaerolineales bacterium]MCX7607970.1 phytoene desaturase family protein [Anaerolineales bacterium]